MDKKELLFKSRTIFCYENIMPRNAEEICQHIQDVNLDTRDKTEEVPLTFTINSGGGDPFAARKIAIWLGDIQEFYEKSETSLKPRILVRGCAISAAAILVTYAKSYKVPVYVEPHTIMNFHDFDIMPQQDWFSRKRLSSLVASYDQFFEEMLATYHQLMNQKISYESLKREVEEEKFYLDSDTILARGLADEIIT